MSLEEYFLKQKFASVEDSLKLFQNDALFHKPGTTLFKVFSSGTPVAKYFVLKMFPTIIRYI